MKHLKQLRKERGLTQAQLGEILHVSRAAIGSYERGTRLPEVETMRRMCDYFQVSLEYILDFSEKRSYDSGQEEVMKLYHSLSVDEQQRVLQILEDYAELSARRKMKK